MVGKHGSTQQTRWLKQEAERAMAQVFKLSAPTPSDILHLARPPKPTHATLPTGHEEFKCGEYGAHLTKALQW